MLQQVINSLCMQHAVCDMKSCITLRPPPPPPPRPLPVRASCAPTDLLHNAPLLSQRSHPAATAALAEGRGGYTDVIAHAERLFCRVRSAVAGRAAPTSLKSALLAPVSNRLPLEVGLKLFACSDADYMELFSGENTGKAC